MDPLLKKLNLEIVQFFHFCTPTLFEDYLRQHAFNEVKFVINSVFPNMEVRLYGSTLTGMYFSDSDLDILLIPKNNTSSSNSKSSGSSPPLTEMSTAGHILMLRKVRKVIEKNSLNAGPIVTVEKTSVPLFKFTHVNTGIKIEVTCNISDSTWLQSACLTKFYTAKYPLLMPIFFFIRRLLMQENLHSAYTGGLGSFVLLNMIISFFQLKFRGPHSLKNLGECLFKFFYFYAKLFDQNRYAISICNNGQHVKKSELPGTVAASLLVVLGPWLTKNDVNIASSTYNYQAVHDFFSHSFSRIMNSSIKNNNNDNNNENSSIKEVFDLRPSYCEINDYRRQQYTKCQDIIRGIYN